MIPEICNTGIRDIIGTGDQTVECNITAWNGNMHLTGINAADILAGTVDQFAGYDLAEIVIATGTADKQRISVDVTCTRMTVLYIRIINRDASSTHIVVNFIGRIVPKDGPGDGGVALSIETDSTTLISGGISGERTISDDVAGKVTV